MKFDASDLLIAEEYVRRLEADPLKHWAWACDEWREAAEYASAGLFVHARGPNRSGKTTLGSAYFTALAEGKRELAGVRLPDVRVPGVYYLNVHGKKMAIDSAIDSYLSAFGGWPHFEAKSSPQLGYVDVMYVGTPKCKHPNGEYCKSCSRIMVNVDDGKPPEGVGVDGVHMDECPSEPVMGELVIRVQANRPLVRMVTETPKDKRLWEPIKRYFDGTLNRPSGGRVEVWCDKVRKNRFLSELAVRTIEEGARGQVLERAILYGEYVDAAGQSPFADWWDVLQRWQGQCRAGKMVEMAVRGAIETEKVRLRVEVWEPPEYNEKYYIPIDPSRGTPGNDPSAIQVWARRKPRLVARFGVRAGVERSGYASTYSLGALGAILSRQYNNGLVDPETQGGYGDAVIVALRQSGCLNIGRWEPPDRPGTSSASYGFPTTAQTRPLWFAAIQNALEESRRADSMGIWSADALSSLMNVRLDEYGRPEEKGLRHGEDVICMGRALHFMSQPDRRLHFKPESPPPVPTIEDALAREGGRVRQKPWEVEEAPSYRMRR